MAELVSCHNDKVGKRRRRNTTLYWREARRPPVVSPELLGNSLLCLDVTFVMRSVYLDRQLVFFFPRPFEAYRHLDFLDVCDVASARFYGICLSFLRMSNQSASLCTLLYIGNQDQLHRSRTTCIAHELPSSNGSRANNNHKEFHLRRTPVVLNLPI